MPLASLQARLVMSLLLILLPVLGGGGLFWFRGEIRHQQAEFDSTLLALADQAGSLLRTPRQKPMGMSPCDLLQPLAQRLSGQGVGVYTPEGEQACSIGTLLPQQKTLPAERISTLLSGQRHFLNHLKGSESWRSLGVPVFRQGQTRFILLINSNYQLQQERERQLAWSLVATLALIMLTAGLLAWLAVRQQLRPLEELADWVGTLQSKKQVRQKPVAQGTAKEIAQIQEGVGDLLVSLASDLSRARQFTADASHELRTPLTILRGETEVALRWSQDPDETRKVLASNLEEIDRMSRIIGDLLLLSKSEVGEMPLQFERVDLLELTKELYQQTRLLGEQKSIAVTYDPPQEKIRIQGDSLRLRQMFLNLLSNAIKYTPESGTVELKVRRLGSLAEIRVADSGIGIASKHLSQIFDRFYRVDKARNRADGGSGLGLSIAQWVAESHGGNIKVQSEPGVGSEFIVVLPLEQKVGGLISGLKVNTEKSSAEP